MNRQDLYERILASLYAAALDDARWPETAGLLDEFCGTKGNFLVTGDGAARDEVDIFFARFCFRGARDVESEREYFGVYHGIDERLPRIRTLPDGRIVSNASLFTEEEKKTSALYNEAMPRGDARDSLVVRLDGPGGSRIVWSVGDPVDGGWSPDRVETIGRLLPHIRQYVSVRQTLADARALGSTTAVLLENMNMGVIQLDRRGRMVKANDRARSILGREDGLRDKDGVLRAGHPGEDETLQRLVARAGPFPDGTGSGGSMRLNGENSVSSLVLHVNPVPANGAHAEARVGALVLLLDPRERGDIDPGRLEDLLDLTPAESQVAALLGQGKSIDGIVAATGRGESTIRWHLRNIYAKHGLTRQVELAQLVATLADLPGGRR